LVRRFAAISVLAEQAEAKLARGETIDISEHALLCSTLTRLAQRIGIDRVARDITTPSLSEYLAELKRADSK
jgi:EAL domain-containing protein (putative c-di-GMP-specific phosphodiesterase class I)